MIKISNVTKTFDDFTAIDNLSLEINNSSIYGLVGYNGAGKTTLLKTIAGVYVPDSGTVEMDGIDLFKHPEKKQELFYVPDDLYFGLSSSMILASSAVLAGALARAFCSKQSALAEIISLTVYSAPQSRQIRRKLRLLRSIHPLPRRARHMGRLLDDVRQCVRRRWCRD